MLSLCSQEGLLDLNLLFPNGYRYKETTMGTQHGKGVIWVLLTIPACFLPLGNVWSQI